MKITPKQFWKSGTVLMSTVLVSGIVATSTVNVKAATNEAAFNEQVDEPDIQIIDPLEFNKLSSIDDQDDFNYELAIYLQSRGVNPEQVSGLIHMRSTRGKGTMAAKAAGKAMQAFLKKMGKKWWEKQSKKWYFPIKVNWKTINAIANFTAGFNGTLENAIAHFLTSHHLANKTVAKTVAKVIVFIFF